MDLGSTNGTFVNEKRITQCELSDGDRPQIGKVLLKYIAGGNIEFAYHEEMQRLMRFDGLTGVHNKSDFEASLNAALSKTHAAPAPVSVIVFDLDHFEQVNDTHGHTAGDALLRQAAAAAQQVLPDRLLARVGGDEFAVLCPGTGLDATLQTAERIRRAVEVGTFAFEGVAIPITASFGCAEFSSGSDKSPQSLYERAWALLQAAKGAGGNRVC